MYAKQYNRFHSIRIRTLTADSRATRLTFLCHTLTIYLHTQVHVKCSMYAYVYLFVYIADIAIKYVYG